MGIKSTGVGFCSRFKHMLSSAIPKANKTTLCASEKKFLFPSDYLLAVAPHNTTNSMIILYPLAPFIIYDHSAPTVNQPKDQLNQFFRPFNTGKIPGLVKVAIAQCQEFFGGK